jgi:hypothetical protein
MRLSVQRHCILSVPYLISRRKSFVGADWRTVVRFNRLRVPTRCSGCYRPATNARGIPLPALPERPKPLPT